MIFNSLNQVALLGIGQNDTLYSYYSFLFGHQGFKSTCLTQNCSESLNSLILLRFTLNSHQWFEPSCFTQITYIFSIGKNLLTKGKNKHIGQALYQWCTSKVYTPNNRVLQNRPLSLKQISTCIGQVLVGCSQPACVSAEIFYFSYMKIRDLNLRKLRVELIQLWTWQAESKF